MAPQDLLDQPPTQPASDESATRVQRLLAVANETLTGDALLEAIRARVTPDAEVLVVCPLLVSRAGYWACDYRTADAEARDRLRASLASLHEAGIRADGTIGDANPVLAIEDALCTFPAEHILVSTHPPGRSTWLERRVVERARSRFPVPVSHVVVDRGGEAASRR